MTELVRRILRRLTRQWAPAFALGVWLALRNPAKHPAVMAGSACALIAAAPVHLTACSSTPQARTVAEARPELAVAYEAAFRAWTWLDARNAALYEGHARTVRGALLQLIDQFLAQCGDQAPACMTAAYDGLMADWEAETGYGERTERLERARVGLEAMRAVLATDPEADMGTWAPAVLATLRALTALGDELKAAGVKLPEVVETGLAALKRLG